MTVSELSTDQILDVGGIDTYYGSSHVLKEVSLTVDRNETVTILGRNGVGKTTTLRSIMGLTPPETGTITLQGEEIQGFEPYQVRRRGVALVPEGRRVFGDLSVEENLRVAANAGDASDLDAIFSRFSKLDDRRSQDAGTLSGGEQQLLAIARGLVGPPTELLLLDEPSEGLDPSHQAEVTDLIRQLQADGVPILLVEQNAEMALSLADRVYMMEMGRIKYEGATENLDAYGGPVEEYMGVK